MTADSTGLELLGRTNRGGYRYQVLQHNGSNYVREFTYDERVRYATWNLLVGNELGFPTCPYHFSEGTVAGIWIGTNTALDADGARSISSAIHRHVDLQSSRCGLGPADSLRRSVSAVRSSPAYWFAKLSTLTSGFRKWPKTGLRDTLSPEQKEARAKARAKERRKTKQPSDRWQIKLRTAETNANSYREKTARYAKLADKWDKKKKAAERYLALALKKENES